MTKKIKYLLFFSFLILILFFLKIDYRYKSDWTCCSDEFDYYAHIKTIVEDKDFDYIVDDYKVIDSDRYLDLILDNRRITLDQERIREIV